MTAQFQFLPSQGLFCSYIVPQICVVGQKFNKGVKTWPEGTVFDYTAGGCRLLLSYRHPTTRLKDAFSGPSPFCAGLQIWTDFPSLQVRGHALAGRTVLVLARAGRDSARS